MNRPLVLVAVLGCTVLFGLAFATGLAGAEEITGDRSFNTSTPASGETVEVTVTAELTEEDDIEFVEDFDPPVDSVWLESVTVDGEPASTLLEISEDDGLVIVLDTVPPGEVELVYHVHVPETAESGSTYEFDGAIGSDAEMFPVGGDTTLTVDGETEPAFFDVSLTAAPPSAIAGEEIDVEYTVENTGDESGTQDIVFSVDGEQVDTEAIELDGGESFDGAFTYEIAEDSEPELEVSVASDDTESSETITVDADDNGDDASVDDTGDDVGTDDTDDTGVDNGDDGDDGDDDGFGPGFGVLTAVLAVGLALALVAVRRR